VPCDLFGLRNDQPILPNSARWRRRSERRAEQASTVASLV